MSDSVWPHRRQPTRLPRPGILQARTLEWAAISFSNAWKWKVKVNSLSRVRLFMTPWTIAYQAHLHYLQGPKKICTPPLPHISDIISSLSGSKLATLDFSETSSRWQNFYTSFCSNAFLLHILMPALSPPSILKNILSVMLFQIIFFWSCSNIPGFVLISCFIFLYSNYTIST